MLLSLYNQFRLLKMINKIDQSNGTWHDFSFKKKIFNNITLKLYKIMFVPWNNHKCNALMLTLFLFQKSLDLFWENYLQIVNDRHDTFFRKNQTVQRYWWIIFCDVRQWQIILIWGFVVRWTFMTFRFINIILHFVSLYILYVPVYD